jgi:hypothetical protein
MGDTTLKIFDADQLQERLSHTRREIEQVVLVAHRRRAYAGPVPDLRELRRLEEELIVRLDALGALETA